MSHDDIFQLPPPQLIAKLTELRSERTAIEGKEDIVMQLLDVYVQQDGDAAEEIAKLGAAVGLGPLRTQIIDVLAASREQNLYVLLPLTVHEVLVQRGNRKVKLDNVRVTMKRMADAGELERPIPEEPLAFALPGSVEEMPPGLLEALRGQLK